MRITQLILIIILACTALALQASPAERKKAVRVFVNEMVAEHGFDRAELMQLMGQARLRNSIINSMNRPAESKPWHRYRPIFVTAKRAQDGARFWRRHRKLLERAEKEYGVPPQIITAIIGVETNYGGNTGSYLVLDALSTLAFGYPKRAKFFRNELKEFLLLSREEHIDPLTTKGSYAGAMGMPQFIPSSYRAYAVDFDGDGRRDLLHSTADAIGSVANYFKRHGWEPGATVTLKARTGDKNLDALVEAGRKPSITPNRLARHGVRVDAKLPANDKVSLVRLEQPKGDDYWVGLNNFYVITRYNHSNLYAMAVYQLSRKILDL